MLATTIQMRRASVFLAALLCATALFAVSAVGANAAAAHFNLTGEVTGIMNSGVKLTLTKAGSTTIVETCTAEEGGFIAHTSNAGLPLVGTITGIGLFDVTTCTDTTHATGDSVLIVPGTQTLGVNAGIYSLTHAAGGGGGSVKAKIGTTTYEVTSMPATTMKWTNGSNGTPPTESKAALANGTSLGTTTNGWAVTATTGFEVGFWGLMAITS